MEQNLRIRVYEDLDDLQDLVPAWEELLSEFPAATVFSTWEWLAPWWRAFGSAQELHVLAFHDESSRLVALAPLAVGKRRFAAGLRVRLLRLMGDGSQDSDNLDLPVRPGYEERFTAALLDYLRTPAIHWDVCELNTLPSQSSGANMLLAGIKQHGWPHSVCPRAWSAVNLPESWEAYLKKLSGKERGKLGYYSRRLEKNHQVHFHRCAVESDLPGCLEALFELHQKRWQQVGEPGSFSSSARREFYRQMGRGLLGRDRLELWLLDLDGRPAAAQFGFRYGNTVFQLQEGYDPAYSLDSVGYVLRGHVLKQLIGQGVRRYDFLAGEDASKARWGAEVGSYVDLHFARPRSVGSFYLQVVHRAAAAKESARRRLPPWAWAALHSLNLRLRGLPDRKTSPREGGPPKSD
jgi:CelD/BcsL family acetyltransferase involved in cellulose biosynthesis